MLIQEANQKLLEMITKILEEKEPKEVLRKTIGFNLNIENNSKLYKLRKFQYKIKWELELNNSNEMELLQEKLVSSFTALRYKRPNNEAELMLMQLEGMTSQFFLQPTFDINNAIQILFYKYGL